MGVHENKLENVARMDNAQLWNLFINGEIEAWEEIFTLFYEDLYGYGLKLSEQPELTKDSIHELFVELWERRDHLSKAISVKAYLLASLRRKLLRKIKRKRKYKVGLEGKEEEIKNGIQFSPEEIIIEKENRNSELTALYGALQCLPDRQKEVLYLKYFNGMSYDEMEEILGINYQSIRNHVYRAMKRLRDMLNQDVSKMAISILLVLTIYLF